MSAHTPGPWEALPIRDDARGFRVREVRHRSDTATGGIHVEVHELGPTGGLGRLDADARLVVAAPELLEALEQALARCEDCGTTGPARCPACAYALSVIAKVRGGK